MYMFAIVWVILQRITNITTKLQYSLEGSFIQGLKTGDVDVLRQCLRTYATIDKISDAENLFRQNVAKPYLMQVCFNVSQYIYVY